MNNKKNQKYMIELNMEFSKKKFLDVDFNANNYYEMINNYTKKQKLKINAKETNSSYLSLDIDLMNLINNNISIRECKTVVMIRYLNIVI